MVEGKPVSSSSLDPQTRSVVRALSVLDCFAEARQPLSIAQISRAVAVSRSSAYRLLRTLQTRGYVMETPSAPGRYQLGPRILDLASCFLERFDLRDVARPHLIQLRDLSQETVHLVIPDRGQVIYIDKVETNQPVRMVSAIGRHAFMHCTAVGKAILAFLPNPEVEAIIREQGLAAHTANTITDAARLEAHLREVSAHGFALDDEENEDGIRCIGAPVLDQRKVPVAAISISGPAYRFTHEQALALSEPLKEAAASISLPLSLAYSA